MLLFFNLYPTPFSILLLHSSKIYNSQLSNLSLHDSFFKSTPTLSPPPRPNIHGRRRNPPTPTLDTAGCLSKDIASSATTTDNEYATNFKQNGPLPLRRCFSILTDIDNSDPLTFSNFKDSPDLLIEIPGLPAISTTEMDVPLLDAKGPTYSEMVYFCKTLLKSRGILVNTFDEPEPVAMAAN